MLGIRNLRPPSRDVRKASRATAVGSEIRTLHFTETVFDLVISLLPVDVIAAMAVEGTVGIGIKAGIVVEVVTRTVEEEEEEDGVVEIVVGKVEEVVGMVGEDLVIVAVVVGMVGKDAGVTEEDAGSILLNRKPETIAEVVVTVVGTGIDGARVNADSGADDGADVTANDGVDDGADDGADVRADGAVVTGAVAVVGGATADDKTGVADTVATSLPWLAGARPKRVIT